MTMNRLPIAQGDLLFVPIDSIPASAKPAKPLNGPHWIVGHSETGHHHVMEKVRGELLEAADNSFIAYIRTLGGDDSSVEIEHKRPFDTHDPVTLGSGAWEVRRQREYSPKGWKRVED